MVFMGYSMPEYDEDIISLVKMALERSQEPEIHVVGWEPEFRSLQQSPLYQRYKDVLGRDFRYFPNGIEEWINAWIPKTG